MEPKIKDHFKMKSIGTRIFVWSLFLVILYVLRSFFLLIFLTFVFSYLLNEASKKLATVISNRPIRIIGITVLFLMTLIGIGTFLVPAIKQQAQVFSSQLPKHLHSLDNELTMLAKEYPLVRSMLPSDLEEGTSDDQWSLKKSYSAGILQDLLGMGSSTEGNISASETAAKIAQFASKILGVGSAFLLSLLFSFLIVFDLNSLSQKVKSLKHSSLQFVYDEVGPSLYDFGATLGKTLQAQFLIAVVNTILTAIGIYILGLGDNIAFLSMVVFLCSFIPVAGVFVSSFPICLLALEQSGFMLMLGAAVLITLIHMIETYILNPKIYGHHLHINPVLVLVILTISGKLFHVWGLVLGIPLCTYFFGHAIWIKGKDTRSDT